MNKNAAPTPNWFGVAFIGVCATADTIATSSIALCIHQAVLYADTHLEGGMAFAAFAFTNFFFFFACLVSAMALLAYMVVFILSLKSTVSPHVKVASLFLIPCVFTLGLLAKRFL